MQPNRIPATSSPQDMWGRKAERIHDDRAAASIVPVVVSAVVAAVIVFAVCFGLRPSEYEQAVAGADHASAQLDETIKALNEGRRPTAPTPYTSDDPWPVRNPAPSALGAFLAILVVGRLSIFMRRLEERR